MVLFSGTIICQGNKYLVNVYCKNTDALPYTITVSDESYTITVDDKPYMLQKSNKMWRAPGLHNELAAKIGAYLPD